MNISLSIDSFPVEAGLAEKLSQLVGQQDGFSELLRTEAWTSAETNGFAVLAQTEVGELLGVASAMDISGIGTFEWTVFVHPDYRRLAIGSALADGIHHGFEQRGADDAMAAFKKEDKAAASFLEGLGYEPGFTEIVYCAPASEAGALPKGSEWNEGGEEGLWELRMDGALLGSLFMEEERGELWVSGIEASTDDATALILGWSRNEAGRRGKERVLLDSDSDEEGTALFEKVGFSPVSSLTYWDRT